MLVDLMLKKRLIKVLRPLRNFNYILPNPLRKFFQNKKFPRKRSPRDLNERHVEHPRNTETGSPRGHVSKPGLYLSRLPLRLGRDNASRFGIYDACTHARKQRRGLFPWVQRLAVTRMSMCLLTRTGPAAVCPRV